MIFDKKKHLHIISDIFIDIFEIFRENYEAHDKENGVYLKQQE